MAYPERRNGDQTAILEAILRNTQQANVKLDAIETHVLSLIQHLRSDFDSSLDDLGTKRPYSLRAGLDDVAAIRARTAMWLADALMVVQADLNTMHDVMGQISNGTYDPEQPAAPRVKRNADGTLVRPARG